MSASLSVPDTVPIVHETAERVVRTMVFGVPPAALVAADRKHHRFSDRQGDPPQPPSRPCAGMRRALRGLCHAHLGWMFRGKDMADPVRMPRTCSPTAIGEHIVVELLKETSAAACQH
jgi:fatty-acid desaturase